MDLGLWVWRLRFIKIHGFMQAVLGRRLAASSEGLHVGSWAIACRTMVTSGNDKGIVRVT